MNQDLKQIIANLEEIRRLMGEWVESLNKPAQPAITEAKQISLEEVRAVLAEKSHDGFTAEIRGLLEKYGAKRLSEIEPAKYSALLADAEAL